jgi:hypothetical protein
VPPPVLSEQAARAVTSSTVGNATDRLPPLMLLWYKDLPGWRERRPVAG